MDGAVPGGPPRSILDAREPAIESVRALLAASQRTPDAQFVDELSTFVAALVDGGALLGREA